MNGSQGNRVVVAGALLACVAAVVVLLLARGEERIVRAGFDNAIQLTSGQQVRMAGRQVGDLGEIDLVDGRAVVEINITDDDVWPLPKGTQARARFGSTTSYLSRYVELLPGPADAGDVEPGAVLRAQSAYELDDGYRIFRGETDERTSELLARLAEGLQDRGLLLRRGLAAAPSGLDATGDLTRELAADEAKLRTLAIAGDQTTSALAAQSAELRELVLRAAGTVEEFAQNTSVQQQALDRAPVTFRESTQTLARLETSLDRADRLLADLRSGAPALRSLAGPARRALGRLRAVAPLAVSALDRGTAAAPSLRTFLVAGSGLLPDVKQALDGFNPMLACIRPYGPEIAGFLSTWMGQLKQFDAEGHYARAFPLTSIPSLQPGTMNTPQQALDVQPGELRYAFPRPPGLNAGKPWFLPQCGAGPESLDPTKDPELER